jgi:ABC-type nitrate/sulfonate/bicarbonate transport system permease component
MLNGVLAFTSLSVELGRFCLSTGAGPLRTFFKVRLPAALPQLFVGLKGAAINATVGATISEMLGGDAGLGYLHRHLRWATSMPTWPSPLSWCSQPRPCHLRRRHIG